MLISDGGNDLLDVGGGAAHDPPLPQRKCIQIRSQLRTGDVIATSSRQFSLVQKFQQLFTDSPTVSTWFTHVALYLGPDEVVEAMPRADLDPLNSGGVFSRSLKEVLTQDRIFVFLRAPIVQEVHWEGICSSASGQVTFPYDYVGCIRAVASATGLTRLASSVRVTRIRPQNKKEGEAVETGKALVCSDFVATVFDEVFQQANPCNLPGGRVHGISTPCEFFANPKFECVPIEPFTLRVGVAALVS